MQTFLPYGDDPKFRKEYKNVDINALQIYFLYTFYHLDTKRLGKQRVEAFQILKALADSSYGWQNHPAVKMWRGYEEALKLYLSYAILVWESKGYNNNMNLPDVQVDKIVLPPWFGNKNLHESHRSNLLRKDPEWYGQFNWNVPNDLPYWWPTKNGY